MPSFTDNYTDKWPSSRPLAPETITKGLKVLKEFTTDLTTQAGQGEEKTKKTARFYTAGCFIGGMVVIIIIIAMVTFAVKLYKGLGSRNYSYLLREEGFGL